MSPDQYCSEKVAREGSSDYYSFLFLRDERRRAITALYALARELHDVSHEIREPVVAHAKLAWWRREIGALYQGQPHHPVTRALVSVVKCYGIEETRLQEFLGGVAMDIQYNAYPDFEALEVYCNRVGSLLASLSAEIFGYRDRRTLDYAESLGVALQLTDIVRDVGRDARRNRVYLPLDEMGRFGITFEDIVQGRESENCRQLLQFQIDRAQGHYDEAFSKLPAVDRRSQCPGLIKAAIGSALLREIHGDPCQLLREAVDLTPLRMFWIACRTRTLQCR